MGYLRSHRLATGGGLAFGLCLLACGGGETRPIGTIELVQNVKVSFDPSPTGNNLGLYLHLDRMPVDPSLPLGQSTSSVARLRVFSTAQLVDGDIDKCIAFYTLPSTTEPEQKVLEIPASTIRAVPNSVNNFETDATYRNLCLPLLPTAGSFNAFANRVKNGWLKVKCTVQKESDPKQVLEGVFFTGQFRAISATPTDVSLGGLVVVQSFPSRIDAKLNVGFPAEWSSAQVQIVDSLGTIGLKATPEPATGNGTLRRNMVFNIKERETSSSIDPRSTEAFDRMLRRLASGGCYLNVILFKHDGTASTTYKFELKNNVTQVGGL